MFKRKIIIVFVLTKYEYSKLYKKVLEKVIEEMKELRDISRGGLFVQNDKARYYLLVWASEFYHENNIKMIDWPQCSFNFKPI